MYLRGNSIGTDDGQRTTTTATTHFKSLLIYDKPIGALPGHDNIRVVYRGGSSHFVGIGILPVSDILGIGIFGRYSRCVGKIVGDVTTLLLLVGVFAWSGGLALGRIRLLRVGGFTLSLGRIQFHRQVNCFSFSFWLCK
jgi:hypothetical protein